MTRLDGMPLAIELAAARMEALGLAGLADRVDDALPLLAGSDRLVAGRHKGLAAMASWSYRLLSVAEQTLAGMETSSREPAALQWLDAEDATLVQAMDWLLERDPPHAQRLAAALAPWLRMRGRSSEA